MAASPKVQLPPRPPPPSITPSTAPPVAPTNSSKPPTPTSSSAPLPPPPPPPSACTTPTAGGGTSSRARVYRTTNAGTVGQQSTWATREIAALDFLLGIPLAAERSIVREGLNAEAHREKDEADSGSSGGRSAILSDEEKTEEEKEAEERTAGPGRWWEKLILKEKGFFFAENQQARRRERLALEERELERPEASSATEKDGNGVGVGVVGVGGGRNGDLSKIYPSEDDTGGELAPHQRGMVAPGRRLDGRDAVQVQIPRDIYVETMTRQRTVARQAAVREWEIRVAHGIYGAGGRGDEDTVEGKGLLDGRVFFSNKGSYPVGVFSVVKYEPEKEKAAAKRRNLELKGRGGTDFIMPERDWRGTSYRALLPRVGKKNKAFNRLIDKNRSPEDRKSARKKKKNRSKRQQQTLSSRSDSQNSEQRNNNDDSADDKRPTSNRSDDGESSTTCDYDSLSSESSSDESDAYVPGFLDDPEMVQGRHRHVMVGDKVTGCLVASTIQFVKPADLKADLNKQFRERFDGWEPPKSQRKFIGAKVIDGVYTLLDPTEVISDEEDMDTITSDEEAHNRRRKGSISADKETIRMPPSLTLSKIRSVKQQALIACRDANLEISTVALACVYFERLCLDCRVDKSNRRMAFASCLLLASKINEANVAIVYDRESGGGGTTTENKTKARGVLHSWIRPTKKSNNIFASLLEFFTHDWNLNLKKLFAAEWGVFAALGFSLHATPTQVAFHFKRLMKVLEWETMTYLRGPPGRQEMYMYNQWQDALVEESVRRDQRDKRREIRRNRQERKLMKLQRELHRKEKGEKAAAAASSKRRSSSTATAVSEEQRTTGMLEGRAALHGVDGEGYRPETTPGGGEGVGSLANNNAPQHAGSTKNVVSSRASPSKSERGGGGPKFWNYRFGLATNKHPSSSKLDKLVGERKLSAHSPKFGYLPHQPYEPLKRSSSSPGLAARGGGHIAIDVSGSEAGTESLDDKNSVHSETKLRDKQPLDGNGTEDGALMV